MYQRLIALGFALAAAGVALAQNTLAADVPTPPANACANQIEADCATATGCVWLPGYTVAGGSQVKGYCRPAPKALTARRGPAAKAE